jgi:glucose uptake protein GlcU
MMGALRIFLGGIHAVVTVIIGIALFSDEYKKDKSELGIITLGVLLLELATTIVLLIGGK